MIVQTDGGKTRNSHVNLHWYVPQIVSKVGAEKVLQQDAKAIASSRSLSEKVDAMRRMISSTSKAWCMPVEGRGEKRCG